MWWRRADGKLAKDVPLTRRVMPYLMKGRNESAVYTEQDIRLQRADAFIRAFNQANPATPIDRIVAAAELAGAHDFILEMPEGYDTIIGERGSSLSGGQRQRIAIARALLMDPRILIFDEATSALDSTAEKAIQAELERIAEGRTTLVIAHRLSTVMDADQILVLQQGHVVERGTHGQLLEAKCEYARMWELQQQAEQAQAVLNDAEIRQQAL